MSNKGVLLELLFVKFLKKYLNVDSNMNINIVVNLIYRIYEIVRFLVLGFMFEKNIEIECFDLFFLKRDFWFEFNYLVKLYIDNKRVNDFD